MQKILADLNYDFSNFTLPHFIDWLEKQNNCRINLVPLTMPPSLFGSWLTTNHAEYIFYDENVPTLHQAHIILHEICHWLCGHRTLNIPDSMVDLIIEMKNEPETFEFFVRFMHKRCLLTSTRQEQEAEILCSLIQQEVMKYQRLRELTTVVSSDQGLTSYFQAMKVL